MDLSFRKKDFNVNTPCALFVIKNFLNENEYQLLYKKFPGKEYFENKKKNVAKETFSSNSENFVKFLQENSSWKEFYMNINSENFVRKAYFESLISNIKSRGLGALRIWSLRKRKSISRFFFREVQIKMNFSRIYESKKIFPHTDVPSKLMSMIYYFADDDWNNEMGGDTVFWKNKKNPKKWQNWENVHINENTLQNFLNDNEIFYVTKFEPNKLVCFFKNKYSWHSVDQINLKNDKIRKVLNIFIRTVN